MAKKINKNTEADNDMNTIMKFIAEQENEVDVELGDIKFKVKKNIPFDEVMEAVAEITSACFLGEDEEYHPEMLEYMTRLECFQRCTNLKLSADYSALYDIMFNKSIWTVVEDALGDYGENIYWMLREYAGEKVDSILNSRYSSVQKKLDEVMDMLSEITSAMSGVDAEDIKNVFGALINGNIDEGKLMEAYMKNKEDV